MTTARRFCLFVSTNGVETVFDSQANRPSRHLTSIDWLVRAQASRKRVPRHLVQELEGREEDFVQNQELVVGRPQRPTLANAGRYEKR